MLANLNSREDSASSDVGRSNGTTRGVTFGRKDGLQAPLSGIQVSSTRTVEIDDTANSYHLHTIRVSHHLL